MSYTCSDAYNDLTQALKLDTPDEWNDDGADHVSEETDLALAEIERLQRTEKRLLSALRAVAKHCNADLYTDAPEFAGAVQRAEDAIQRACRVVERAAKRGRA